MTKAGKSKRMRELGRYAGVFFLGIVSQWNWLLDNPAARSYILRISLGLVLGVIAVGIWMVCDRKWKRSVRFAAWSSRLLAICGAMSATLAGASVFNVLLPASGVLILGVVLAALFSRQIGTLSFLMVLLFLTPFFAAKWDHARFVGFPMASGLPSPQIWCHRGLMVNGARGNTPQSVEEARRAGCSGIELDVNVTPAREILIIYTLGEQLPEHPFYLNEVFQKAGADFYYWLDFKNLSPENAVTVGDILNRLPPQLQARIYVENPDPRAIRALKQAIPWVKTLFWLKRPLETQRQVQWLFREVVESGANVLSFPFEAGEKYYFDFARDKPRAVFTVNEEEKVRAYLDAGAEIILSDRDFSHTLPAYYRSRGVK